MAVLTRAQIITKINNWITTNNNKEITGAQLNEILQDIADSGFLQLDELRTALSTSYSPGTPSDWNATIPTETKAALDQLAQRMRTIESIGTSLTTAFVDPEGDDFTAEVGVITKPFATFAAAIAAVPNSNFKIVSLGGTFSGDITILSKSNFILDLRGTTINTATPTIGVRLQSCTNGNVLLDGGVINGLLSLSTSGSEDCSVNGGKITATGGSCLFIGEGSIVYGVKMQNNVNATVQSEATDFENRPFVSNCRIISTSAVANQDALYRVRDATFDTCYIKGASALSTEPSGDYCYLIDCTLISTVSRTLNGENGVLNAVFKDCTLKSEASGTDVVYMASTSTNTRFYRCSIISQRHCVDIASNISRSGDNTLFYSCDFYCNQDGVSGGKILNDVANADTGKTEFVNSLYNDTWSAVAANAFDNNSTTVANLLPPPL